MTNYIDLVKNDFNEYSILSVKDILKGLKLFLKSSNFVVDGKIPMEWYATTLIEYLDKIPQELTKNNCELLFNEIEKDLNNSLQELDFEALSVCLGYMKFSQKGISYYEKAKEVLSEDMLTMDLGVETSNPGEVHERIYSLLEAGGYHSYYCKG